MKRIKRFPIRKQRHSDKRKLIKELKDGAYEYDSNDQDKRSYNGDTTGSK
jgi:hypothetical protein